MNTWETKEEGAGNIPVCLKFQGSCLFFSFFRHSQNVMDKGEDELSQMVSKNQTSTMTGFRRLQKLKGPGF